jgi:hypothetical protein
LVTFDFQPITVRAGAIKWGHVLNSPQRHPPRRRRRLALLRGNPRSHPQDLQPAADQADEDVKR